MTLALTIVAILDLVSFLMFSATAFVWWHLARKDAPHEVLQRWGAASLVFLMISLVCTYALY